VKGGLSLWKVFPLSPDHPLKSQNLNATCWSGTDFKEKFYKITHGDLKRLRQKLVKLGWVMALVCLSHNTTEIKPYSKNEICEFHDYNGCCHGESVRDLPHIGSCKVMSALRLLGKPKH
jgi:hypothetical protein